MTKIKFEVKDSIGLRLYSGLRTGELIVNLVKDYYKVWYFESNQSITKPIKYVGRQKRKDIEILPT